MLTKSSNSIKLVYYFSFSIVVQQGCNNIIILRNRQRMLSSKRRPTTSNKHSSKSKIQTSSAIVHKRIPTPNQLVAKKYYLPVLQEDQRIRTFQMSKFIAGFHSQDILGLGQIVRMHNQHQWLTKYYSKPQENIKKVVLDIITHEQDSFLVVKKSAMHFYSFPFYLLLDHHRRIKEYVLKKSFAKKQSQRSTDFSSKKQGNVLAYSTIIKYKQKQKQKLSESHELNKLSKCLKNVLKKHDKGKSYKLFLEQMEKRKSNIQAQKSEGMLKLILNLQKDFSSIHQETHEDGDFSKQSIYGLSDLKKKSDKNNSKIQPNKIKDKRLSTNFGLCKLDFARKVRQVQKSTKGISNSKTSKKSTSLRSKKGNNTNTPTTPDHHSKSKSRTKKNSLKTTATDKKSKLTDTQKLYFDEQKIQEKTQSKHSQLGVKKVQLDCVKSKKKLVKK